MLVIVSNIPSDLRTADLRNFFSHFLESGRFTCFHYRHRVDSLDETTCWSPLEVQEHYVEDFIAYYADQNWIDCKNELRTTKVQIYVSEVSKFLKARGLESDIEDAKAILKELNPPSSFPKGSVGTPTAYFFEEIAKCQLPASLIKKLGLKFPKQRSNRRYGSVPYSYDGAKHISDESDAEMMNDKSATKTANGFVLKSLEEAKVKKLNQRKRDTAAALKAKLTEADEAESSGSDGEEDWERGERLHENTFEQDRIKERLFEDEVELVWEKGSSGLVFYCDSALWEEAKGDFDERTTDDLDVDMSLYWKGQGANADQDAKDFVNMRKQQMLRAGHQYKIKPRLDSGKKLNPDFARQLMMKQGWKPGQSLGSSQPGIIEPIEAEGPKNPKERRGLGYRGEKLNRNVVSNTIKSRADLKHKISTLYDPVMEEDVMESLLEWAPATALKQRKTK